MAWTTPPASFPFTLTVQLTAPEVAVDTVHISHQTEYRTGGGRLLSEVHRRTLKPGTTCSAAITARLTEFGTTSYALTAENPDGEAEGAPDGESSMSFMPLIELQGASVCNGITHTADQDTNWNITLSELLRVIQFYNSEGYHCSASGEDGFAPGPGDQTCAPHNSDYNTQDWDIALTELLRLIQFYNFGAYRQDTTGEDGYATSVEQGLDSANGAIVLPVGGLSFIYDNLAMTINGAPFFPDTEGTYQVDFTWKNCPACCEIQLTVHVLPAEKVLVLGSADVVQGCGGPASLAPPITEPGYTARKYYGAPLEPVDGIFVGAGQDQAAHFEGFVSSMTDTGGSTPPALTMLYMETPILNTAFEPQDSCVASRLLRFSLEQFDAAGDFAAEEHYIPQIGLALHSRLENLDGANCGQNEKQSITIQSSGGTLSGGTFSLKVYTAETAPVAFDATATEVRDALQQVLDDSSGLCSDPESPLLVVTQTTDTSTTKAWGIEFVGGFHLQNIQDTLDVEFADTNVMCSGGGCSVDHAATTVQDGHGLATFNHDGIGIDIPLATYSDVAVEPVLAEIADALAVISGPERRPFFLRIGYEPGDPRNNCCPSAYVVAFRRIVDYLRDRGMNFASVWHTQADTGSWDWRSFYPGDDHVDWLAVPIFYSDHLPGVTGSNRTAQLTLLDFARAHNKPVMIGESSPIQAGSKWCTNEIFDEFAPELTCEEESNSNTAWGVWYGPYFEHIKTSENIKAFCYINNDWNANAGTDLQYVGWSKDARLGSNPAVAGQFRAEVRKAVYRTRADVPEVVDAAQCRPWSVFAPGKDADGFDTDSQEWLRFLSNGDLITTAQANDFAGTPGTPNVFNYASAPTCAIINAAGRILLATDKASQSLFLRGQLYSPAEAISNDTGRSEFTYVDDSGVIVAKLDLDGNLRIRGNLRTTPAFTWPEGLSYKALPEDGYFGFRNGGTECPEENASGDCLCYWDTPWYNLESACPEFLSGL